MKKNFSDMARPRRLLYYQNIVKVERRDKRKENFRYGSTETPLIIIFITKNLMAAMSLLCWLMQSADEDMTAAVATACHGENVAAVVLYVLSAAYVVRYFVGDDH